MASPNIQIDNVNTLSTIDLIAKLRDVGETKLKNKASIRVGSETFKLTYVKGDDGTEKLQVKRHYTGFLIGPLQNLFKRSTLTTHPTALALNTKIAELMNSNDFQISRNAYDKLMGIAKTHTGDANGVIEVANYGHSKPRDTIKEKNVLEAVNQTLKSTKSGKSIRLNMIDTYNTELGITVGTLVPDKYAETMRKISGGTLKIDEEYIEKHHFTVEHEDLEQWRKYISTPEIAAKIDIPKKLHDYLTQSAASGEDKNLVGWKKDFQMNPNDALRHFVIKNMPPQVMRTGKLNDEVINTMCDKLRNYVEIYNMEDGPEKQKRLEEFFDFSKWDCTDADKTHIDEKINKLIEAKAKELNIESDSAKRLYGTAIKQDFYKGKPSQALKSLGSYIIFGNMLMYATFRQTSKIGLNFFKSQGKPILFHTSNRNLTDFGDIGWIKGQNHWKTGKGKLDQTYGGSEITHSEVRHATRLVQRYGEGTDGANIWFVKGAQASTP